MDNFCLVISIHFLTVESTAFVRLAAVQYYGFESIDGKLNFNPKLADFSNLGVKLLSLQQRGKSQRSVMFDIFFLIFMLQDLQHPNEFIRGSTLRFLCKLKVCVNF